MSEIIKSSSFATRLDIKTMDDLARLSNVLAKSGYFTDARDAGQAAVKVLAGMEMGFPSIASMTGIHLVKGKVQLGANLIAAAIKRSGVYDYKIMRGEDNKLRFNDKECAIVFYQNGEEIGESVFTIEDAKRQNTQNLDKFPKNMLFARAISNGAKWFCPDIFLGVAVYSEGEIAELPDELPPTIPADIEAEIVNDRPAILNEKIKSLGLSFSVARKLLVEELNRTDPSELNEVQFQWLLKQLDLIAEELDQSEAQAINGSVATASGN